MTVSSTTADKAQADNVTSQHEDHEQLQLVTFVIGNEEFAVDILRVQEINRMMQITRVPQSPGCVEGVINLRGRIIPVIDMRNRFGLDKSEHSSDSRIVVVEVDEWILGFIVDRVNEVLRISSGIVEPAPAAASKVDSTYIQGIGKLEDRLLILLDLSKLFNADEVRDFEAAARSAAKSAEVEKAA